MPLVGRVPTGRTKFGKPVYRRAFFCVWDKCEFEGSPDEVREHERKHREDFNA